MRLGLDIRGGVDDEQLAFGAQLGATDAIGGDACMPSDSGYFEFLELVVFRQRVESSGLRLFAIENMPWEWTDKIKLGLPGRDEQIDNFCKSLRNMGAAGIPAIGYNFRPPTVTGYGVRTSQSAPGRGGAKQTAFNYDLIKDHPFGDYGEVSAEQMWDNLEYFLKAVVPVAEDAGVRMAVHPDDPPAQSIGGVARILNSFDGLKRLTQIVDSEYNALDFCQGSMAVQHGDLHEAIRHFGARDRIVYVHFRNVTGRFPAFSEAFIDEGYVDMAEAVKVYKEVGFDGPVIEDHVPTMIGDDPDKYRARAHAMGYTKALIDAIYGR